MIYVYYDFFKFSVIRLIIFKRVSFSNHTLLINNNLAIYFLTSYDS